MQSEPFLDETLHIVGKDLSGQSGFTLFAIMHDEMYFLPQLLEHYRKHGVKRFILVDDQSTDGSREFALAQDDVMVMQSAHRFSDQIPAPQGHKKPKDSAMIAWRDTLFTRFGQNQWCLFVDMDEFVDLPNEMRFDEFTAQFPAKPSVIWGVMMDMYPRQWSDVIENPPPALDAVHWYFDARPHIALRKRAGQVPRTLYSGARARLKVQFANVKTDEPFKRKLHRLMTRNPYPRMESLYKPCLIYWDDGFYFNGCHSVIGPKAQNVILPILHFKFAPNFVSRFEYAIASGAYHDDSKSYKELKTLYETMSAEQADFLAPCSKRYEGFADFVKAGVSFGLDQNAHRL